ncbi:MAG: HDOD domain-containing protein [Candidatus Hydrogenedens sp.]
MEELTKYTVENLLSETVTLPSLPASVQNILAIIENPNTKLADLSHAISLDPSISFKLLRLVNSAYYGLGQKVTSIEHAIVLLGTKVIRNLVITATVFSQMGKMAQNMVMHSVAVGVAMDSVVSMGPLKEVYTKGDTGFVFGLLHDIGKMFLLEFLPKHWAGVCHCAKEGGYGSWIAIEQQIIGVDHAQVGGKIAEEWKLSEDLCTAVQYHHEPWDAKNERQQLICASLCVADYIVRASGLSAYEHELHPLREDVWTMAGLNNRLLIDIINLYFDKHAFIEELMNYTVT